MTTYPTDHYDPDIHDDDQPLRGPGCWPVIVMCVLAWAILGWLAYMAWLLFGNPVPIL